MHVKLATIIGSVSDVWADTGVTPFTATCAVYGVARELGYPSAAETGVWANDTAPLLRLVAARLREATR